MASVELSGLTRRFPGGFEALRGVDLAIADSERIAILGPSGSGKTTLLRLIAGLDEATGGSVRIGGRDVTPLPPWRRDVGLVFQQPALMPHLSVRDNLAFGLRPAKLSRAEIDRRVGEVAGWLGLTELLARRPAQLSGGQRQRVAIGRALARRPSVLLLDEPLANLDAPLRQAIRRELEDLQRRERLTMVLVTHDQAEALAFGDRVGVLVDGRLLQLDSPRAVYDRPGHRAVATFVGSPPMDLIPATLSESPGGTPVLTLDGSGTIELGVRPEALRPADVASGLRVAGRVRSVTPTGPEEIVTIDLEPSCGTIHLRRRPGDGPGIGQRIELAIDLEAVAWFDAKTGERLEEAPLTRHAIANASD